MQKVILTTAICLTLSLSANAQQHEYKGGMQYTTLGSNNVQPSEEKPLYNRKEETPQTPETEAEVTPKKPADSAWERYKELAAGTAGDKDEDNAKPKAPEKPDAPKSSSKSETPEKPTGIASIIADYQRNKAKRSQIQHMNISKPEKPSVETPKTE